MSQTATQTAEQRRAEQRRCHRRRLRRTIEDYEADDRAWIQSRLPGLHQQLASLEAAMRASGETLE